MSPSYDRSSCFPCLERKQHCQLLGNSLPLTCSQIIFSARMFWAGFSLTQFNRPLSDQLTPLIVPVTSGKENTFWFGAAVKWCEWYWCQLTRNVWNWTSAGGSCFFFFIARLEEDTGYIDCVYNIWDKTDENINSFETLDEGRQNSLCNFWGAINLQT